MTELKLDDATIVTALLHDVIEDTDATRAEIDQLFGPEIGALVDGLTKIKRLDLISKQAEQAENFRKLLLAISSDIRVLLVKLADRLHNMRTLEHMKPESRKRNSEETLEIYAPLAGRMGMQALRDELEEHAFRWLYPDAYKTVTEKLAEIRTKNEGLVDEIAKALSQKLSEVGIKAEVSGREKKPYSVWSKMANKQISLEQLSDIYAFRVVVDTIDDCYRVLGVSHTTWRTVPGRFKDYISTPKQNNYQSIHTTVVGPRHQRVELQIRTREMHTIAEYGVAAHALYKDGQRVNGSDHGGSKNPAIFDKESGPYVWLRRLVETLLEGSNPEEFLEHTKLELFQDQVFCFSPKAGSSHCRGARRRSTSPTPCTPTWAHRRVILAMGDQTPPCFIHDQPPDTPAFMGAGAHHGVDGIVRLGVAQQADALPALRSGCGRECRIAADSAGSPLAAAQRPPAHRQSEVSTRIYSSTQSGAASYQAAPAGSGASGPQSALRQTMSQSR